MRNLSILPPPLLKSWLRPCPSAASDLYLAFSGSRFDLNIELECVDDLYLHITLNYCAHEQKAHGLQFKNFARFARNLSILPPFAKILAQPQSDLLMSNHDHT